MYLLSRILLNTHEIMAQLQSKQGRNIHSKCCHWYVKILAEYYLWWWSKYFVKMSRKKIIFREKERKFTFWILTSDHIKDSSSTGSRETTHLKKTLSVWCTKALVQTAVCTSVQYDMFVFFIAAIILDKIYYLGFWVVIFGWNL